MILQESNRRNIIKRSMSQIDRKRKEGDRGEKIKQRKEDRSIEYRNWKEVIEDIEKRER